MIPQTPTLHQLRRLDKFQEKREIPRQDLDWWWKTFKALKESGYHYEKAWSYTCWALEHSYGYEPNTYPNKEIPNVTP